MQDQAIVQPESKFKAGPVLAISAGHFVHDVYSAFLAPLLPLLIEKMSLTLTMAGSLTACLQVPAVLTPLIGHYADKHNLRFFVILAPGLTATMMSAMGLAPGYPQLVIILLIAGVSVAFYHGPGPAMVGSASGKRTGLGMSFFMGGGELARAAGPMIAVGVVSLWTLEGMFRVVVVGWLASLFLYFYTRNIPISPRKGGSLESILPKLRTLFLPLFLIIIFRMFMMVSMTTYLPTFMSQKGATLFLAGASLSILEIAGVAGVLASGTISDWLGRKRVLLIVTFLAPLAMIAFINVEGAMIVPVLLFYGFVSIAPGPVYLALIQDHFPDNRAVSNGLYISMSFVVRSLAMVLVGVAGDAFGLRTAFIGSALLSLFSLGGILMLPLEHENQPA